MNQDAQPRATGPSWLQVFVQFDDYTAAEHTGVAHLRPVMTDAEEAGLVACWWFVRKTPCWRLRYLGNDHAATSAGRSDRRRELSILLCATLMRGAGQDWYEQGDIWAAWPRTGPYPLGRPLTGCAATNPT